MVNEAPADTAGPSSPPPKLPEGWLPQWEGVQRQWYYVQRATGKSQWEIPTEPVALTPSTTPTSIGTGPSQAPPLRPATESPSVTMSGNSLVDRMESAADKTRISSSASSHLNGQMSASLQGPTGIVGWPSTLDTQHASHQTQPLGSGDGRYATEHFHHPSRGKPKPETIYAGQPQHLAQAEEQPNWGSHVLMTPSHPSGSTAEPAAKANGIPNMERHRSCQLLHYVPSMAYSAPYHSGATYPLLQTQWQSERHHFESSHAPATISNHSTSLTMYDPPHGSDPSSQSSGNRPKDITSRSSQSFIPPHAGCAIGSHQQEMLRSHSSRSPHVYPMPDQAHDTVGHQSYQILPHQSVGFQSGQQDLPAIPHAQTQLHHYDPNLPSPPTFRRNPGGSQKRPGGSFNLMALSSAPSSYGGAQHYQNPIVQAGVRHYLPQAETRDVSSDIYGMRHHPQLEPPSVHQGQWVGSSGASGIVAQDSQFVSGPWASSTSPSSNETQRRH